MNAIIKLFTLIYLTTLCLPAIPQTKMKDHPWQGKKIAYLGDSITDPRVKKGTEKWWTYLERWLESQSYVYAISGKQWNSIPQQADKLKAEHGDDFDAIIIFIGTNDFNAGVPVGEWYEEKDEQVLVAVHKDKEMATRKKREPIMTKETFRGRINIAMNKLKTMWPTKQIVVLTPIHRAFAQFSEKNIQPTEAYQNACGEWFNKYVESVRQIADVWAVPVIDLAATSGLFPLLPEYHQYFSNPETDQLHPNDKGYQRMAATIYYQLSALPCVFE